MSKNSNLSRLAHIVTANSSNSVTLSGNVTASHFVGDGSQLTNLTVPGAGGGSAVVNGHITGNTLVLIKSNDISINLDLDDFANRIIDAAGGGGGNPTTSVAMSGNTMLFTRDDASTYSVDLDDFANRIIDVNAALIPTLPANTSTSTAAMSGNTMLFTRDDASTFSVDLDNFVNQIIDVNATLIAALPANPANTSTSTAAMSGNTMLFTRDDASTFSVDLDDFTDRILDAVPATPANTSTSTAAMSGNTMLFTRENATTFSVDMDETFNHIIDAAGGGGGGGASELDDLSDVTISSVADGDLLRYNGTSSVFENTNLGVTVTPIINAVSSSTQGGPITFSDTQYEHHTDPDYHVQLVDAANTADIKVTNGSVTRLDENGNFSLVLPADGGGGNYTIQMRAQNFGSLASETATANVETVGVFGFTGRYVKFQNWVGLVSADISLNSLRVYTGSGGTGTELPSSAMTSASAPSPFVITSTDTGYGSYSFWKAFGGNYDAFWTLSTSSTNDNLWLKIDLGASYTINSIRVGGSYLPHKATGVTIAYSTDDVSYTLSDSVEFDIQTNYYAGSQVVG